MHGSRWRGIMSKAQEPLVRFIEVQKSYDGEILVVKNLNLDVTRGEFLTMLGPSGSGKTTLVDLILGLLQPQRGKIYYNGIDINDNLDEWYPFSQGITKRDGSKIPAGAIKRPELETMQYFVKGIVNKFPTK